MPNKDDGRGWYGESERHAKAAKKANQGRIRSAYRGLAGAVKTVLAIPMALLGFLGRQARGTWRNFGRAWNYMTFDNVMPPSVVSLIQWFIETIPKLFGIRDTTPWQQVGAAATVIGAALLATVLSGGLLIGTVIIVTFFGFVGVIRHVPWFNDKWERATGTLPIKNDYDVPRWRRD